MATIPRPSIQEALFVFKEQITSLQEWLLNFIYYKVIKKRQRRLRGKNSEVILIIECDKKQGDTVEEILWHHFALGTARVAIE